MVLNALGMMLTAVLLLGEVALSQAELLRDYPIGIRMGLSGPNKGEAFQEVEVFALLPLPWRWQWDSGWSVSTQIDLAIGMLSGAGQTGVLSSLAPGLEVSRRDSRFSLLAHTGIVLVSEHDFGEQPIGGPFQFGLYTGAIYRFDNGIRLSYRYRHLSNASLSHPNPGLEMHFIGFSYAFQRHSRK